MDQTDHAPTTAVATQIPSATAICTPPSLACDERRGRGNFLKQRPGVTSASAHGRSFARRGLAAAAALLLAGCVHLPHPDIPQASAEQSGLAVFDIDGTLTPRVPSILSARPDAAAVVRLYAERGHRIVYLTARAPELQGTLRSYLYRRGFPAGDLVVPQTRVEHVAPAPFKAGVLNGYRAQGWDIVAAYGDSSTDFSAYADAQVPRHRVFALQRVGSTACKPGVWAACLPGWTAHLRAIAATGQVGQETESE